MDKGVAENGGERQRRLRDGAVFALFSLKSSETRFLKTLIGCARAKSRNAGRAISNSALAGIKVLIALEMFINPAGFTLHAFNTVQDAMT